MARTLRLSSPRLCALRIRVPVLHLQVFRLPIAAALRQVLFSHL